MKISSDKPIIKGPDFKYLFVRHMLMIFQEDHFFELHY